MDYNRLIEALITSILSGGGAVGLLNWWRVRKSRKRGVSDKEHVAIAETAKAELPLTRYLQKELSALRREYAEYRRTTDHEIAALEAHIWERKPPPPPNTNHQGRPKNG